MTQQVPFAQQLKRERERRSWSQSDLASRLGTDPKTVGRWEAGLSRPRPYHRQALCELFGKSAEEFGLLESDVDTSLLSTDPDGVDAPAALSAIPPSPAEQQERVPDPLPHYEDWGNAPQVEHFYGRTTEVQLLQQWLVEEKCRVITLTGMGGMGKTTLASAVAHATKDAFTFIFWRSLYNAPPLKHLLQRCLQFLTQQPSLLLPESLDDQFELLLQQLRQHRCLLILDNVESLLQPGQQVGHYRPGYESYGALLQLLGTTQHQSCLLLTSREQPAEVALLEGTTSPVRSFPLAGLDSAAGQELLHHKALSGTSEQWTSLVDLYSGNPLALMLVSQSIRGIFHGHIAHFLQQPESAFDKIDNLLEQQFLRLSKQEQDILYWLAIERETVTVDALQAASVRPLSPGALLAALDSLRQRSLIEVRGPALCTLQPVIMEYVTSRLITLAYQGMLALRLPTWASYAFIQAQAKDYIRATQIRLLLEPLIARLQHTLSKDELEQQARQMLATQREKSTPPRNYLASNVLHLLTHVQNSNLSGLDCSHLPIRQAYLQHAPLPAVNFAHAHFIDSIFTYAFGTISAIAFHPHETMLAIGTAQGAIWLYQFPSGIPLLTCLGHTDSVWSLAFVPEQHLLISSSDDQTIRLWDTTTGNCLHVLREHDGRVRALACSPDEMVLVSGSDDQTVRLWDLHTYTCTHILRGHAERVWAVAFHPDGTLLASGSTDGTVLLWDRGTGQLLKTLPGHTGAIRSLAFSADGRILASGSDDTTVRLWDPTTGACAHILHDHSNRIWSVAFQPNGNGHVLASGCEDTTIRLWDAASGRCLHVLEGHTNGIRSVAFSPDGQLLASGGDDQSLHLWDSTNGYSLKTLHGYAKRIWSLALNPSAPMLVSASEDQYIRLWQTTTGHCLASWYNATHRARAIAFSPDGLTVASGGEDQTLRLWETKSGHCLAVMRGHTNWVWTVAFSPNGQLLASGGEDQSVRIWSTHTHESLHHLQGHNKWVRTVAFSPDSTQLATAGDDQRILLWHTSTGAALATLEGHTKRIRAVCFSPDGSLLASGGEDCTIRLWEVATGHCRAILHEHTHWVRTLAFSPDGQLLASGSQDQTIRLWDLATARSTHTLEGHSSRIRAVAFLPHEPLLASGDDDGTIRLWSLHTFQPTMTLTNPLPYEHMDITEATGLTSAQKSALKALGAIDRSALNDDS